MIGNRTKGEFSTWMLVFWLIFPALATWSYFTLQWWPQVLNPLSKVVLVVAPLLFWCRNGWSLSTIFKRAGVVRTNGIIGVVSGAVFGAIIWCAWLLCFQGQLDGSNIAAKLTSLNLIEHYWSVAIFMALANSLLEEWYWRGFVYDQLVQRALSRPAIVALGGVGFGLHHYFTLIVYFPLSVTLFFTCVTMIAGGAWSVMRLKGVSLIDCYVSHIVADFALLWIGWQLLGGTHGL